MYGLKEKHIKAINSVFSKYPQIEKAILYGSRAKGNYRNGSDIDLTLVGNDLDLTTLFKIETKLDDLLLPYKMDLSILHKIENPDLTDHIKRVGITFYEKIENEWKEVKLGDFFKVKHGYAFKGKYITKEETADILVTPGNFHIGGGFKNTNNKYYNNDDYPESYILKTGDTIVTMTDLSKETDTLGYSAKIPVSQEKKYLHNQRVGLVQFKNEDANFDFLYWIMRTREYQGYIIGSASGTSIMHTSPTRIQDYSFLSPSNKEEQKQIAEILTSLDDKIDLLHRQNKTLEAMAETLFREWFVENAEEDWEEGVLQDEFDFTMGQSPLGSTFNEEGEGTPMYQGNRDFAFRFPTKRVYTTDPKRFALKFDTLVSVRAPVGAQNMANEKCCIGRGVAAFRYKSNFEFYTYTYFKMRSLMGEIKKFNDEGTVFGSIGKSDFEKLNVVIPPSELVEKYQNEVKPIDDKVILNCGQITKLEKLRDTLLPKLMSGEIKVENI